MHWLPTPSPLLPLASCMQIVAIQKNLENFPRSRDVIVVSSGAVAHGRNKLSHEEYMSVPISRIQGLKHKDQVEHTHCSNMEAGHSYTVCSRHKGVNPFKKLCLYMRHA